MKDKNALVPAEWQDAAQKILKATANSRAPILKLKKSHYYLGETEVPMGRKYRAYCIDWRRGWRKWKDGEVVDDRVVRVVDDPTEPVEREELDERDESLWPIVDDEPQDPWTCENQLPIEDATGELLLFSSSSAGGKIAVEKLCRNAARNTHLGLPTIRLSVGEFNTKRYKHIPRPDFPVVAWENDDGGNRVISGSGNSGGGGVMIDVTPSKDEPPSDDAPPWEPEAGR